MAIRSWLAALFLAAGTVASAATITVQPGELIVLAVNKAKAGDVIEVMPGEYRQNLEIGIAGVTVRGLEKNGERVVLNGKVDDEAEPLNAGIWITANNVTMEGFVVENFAAIGVGVMDCADVTVRDVSVTGGMTAGISVERAQRVTLERVAAGNSNDAAFSFGNASSITVRDSDGFGSNAGLQLFSTEQVLVESSSFFGNRVGLMIGMAGGPAVKSPQYTTIRRCRVIGNNGAAAANYASPFKIADGTGILVWGASHTEIVDCVIAENSTIGIATLAADRGGVRHLDKEAERTGAPAEHTYVHHNAYSRNGLAPAKIWNANFPDIPAGDLYWDGLGERNQFQETGNLLTYPPKLVVEQGGVHTSVIHFQ